jgi:hypothetical protein
MLQLGLSHGNMSTRGRRIATYRLPSLSDVNRQMMSMVRLIAELPTDIEKGLIVPRLLIKMAPKLLSAVILPWNSSTTEVKSNK